jgi:hypothetical protein
MNELRREFENYFLSLDRDFGREELTTISSTGKYFYTTTQALYDQFREIKHLQNMVGMYKVQSQGRYGKLG